MVVSGLALKEYLRGNFPWNNEANRFLFIYLEETG